MEEQSLDLSEHEELYVTGEVLAIFFSNPSNFYKVMLIEVEDTNSEYPDDEITMTGNFGRIQEGSSYKFYGELSNHPKYGVQFKVDRYETSQPSSSESLINYLSSSQFKGIGEKTAEKVVEALGESVIDSIVENPAVLDQVSGLSKKQKETLEEVLSNEYGMQKMILQLNRFGIDNTLAFRIYGKYEERTSEVIRENPYQLILEIEGIGFNRADMIADHLDVKADANERIQAAIFYALFTISNDSGDTYVTKDHLIDKSIEILEGSRSFLIDRELVIQNLEIMRVEGRIYEEEGRYYLATIYHSEWGIVRSMELLLDGEETPISDKQFKTEIKKLENDLEIEYGDSQKTAIKEALESSVFILTGGPGTGKTTVLKGIVNLFAELNDLSLDPYAYKDEAFPILLAAPTGRAAKRMKETTELPASTIHRLLGLTADDEDLKDDGDYLLDGKLLIIDEMSMVDTFLANRLFQSIPVGMKVILVGDQDQLPSVGPGQVFRDLIDSGEIPQTELKDIYRQGDGSSIIPLAHEIKHNRLPKDFMEKKKDRNFFRANSTTAVPLIEKIVEKAMEKGYTSEDIQVLAPMYKGPAGINVLNERLQEIFNPNPDGSRTEMKHMDTIYRIGDKVLQLQNDPENDVFNGDLGFVTSMTKAKYTDLKTDIITVDFEGKEVEYLRANFNKITLAYCTSIHKAQGSEYDIVILPMVSSYGRMLKKDLLYTAITRASFSLSLIGEPQAFLRSLESKQNLRNTGLKEKLQSDKHGFTVEKSIEVEESAEEESPDSQAHSEQQPAKPKSFILTPEMVETFAIDAMIGMDGIKP